MGTILLVIALGYLAYTLRDEVDEMQAALARISVAGFLAATALALVMCYLKAIYHRTLLSRISGRHEHLEAVVPAYAQAQVVRYLPGKVWGLVHQANKLSSLFTPQQVMLANLLQMLVTNLMAVGIIGSILAAHLTGQAWLLLGLPLTLLVVEALHRRPVLEQSIVTLAMKASRGRFGTQDLARTPIAPIPWRGTALLCLEWIAFYAMWLVAADGWLAMPDLLLLGTWYAAASLLGIVAIAVPAGMIVREALFVSLGGLSAYPEGLLLVLAAALRIVMTLGELALIPIALLVSRLGGKPGARHG
ncbi:hypothetical protein [Arenimonas sp.]|uniref:hypothetical protein n=1 Tax=Arenimonas sp. TaxID=1872635 RepID=UPI0025C4B21E|nr:hypothetical protein [Arenimonas sp.]